MAKTSVATRERIIQAAAKLFHGEGIRAVSVDAIANKAAITKRTLYYHFRSKDDLIAAYLEARDQTNLALFKQWFAESEGDVPEKVAGSLPRSPTLRRNGGSRRLKMCGA